MTYRITRPIEYHCQPCPDSRLLGLRRGYYFEAPSVYDAVRLAERQFPNDRTFTVQGESADGSFFLIGEFVPRPEPRAL